MTQLPRIQSLSIWSIVSNGLFLLILVSQYITRAGNEQSAMERAVSFTLGAGFAFCILYDVLLLVIRRKYYRYTPIKAGLRVVVGIVRIIQLLFSIFLLVAMISVGYDLTKASIQEPRWGLVVVMVLVLSMLTLNIILFFKGWRLLKLVRRNNYIDDVMATFDGDLSKQ